MRADFLTGFVGLAVLGDSVGEGFGSAGVEAGAACFGTEDGSVSGSSERDGRGLREGLDAADGNHHSRRSDGNCDGCLVEDFGSGGWGKSDKRGRGGGDVAGDIDGRDLGGRSNVQA